MERADAISGVPDWDALQERIAAGWAKMPLDIDTLGWRYDAGHGLWVSPSDPAFDALQD